MSKTKVLASDAVRKFTTTLNFPRKTGRKIELDKCFALKYFRLVQHDSNQQA